MRKDAGSDLRSRVHLALEGLPPRQQAIVLALAEEDAPTYLELGERFGIDATEVEREFAAALVALATAADAGP